MIRDTIRIENQIPILLHVSPLGEGRKRQEAYTASETQNGIGKNQY